jgi:GNAT superfamily N-acetyltransferase
MSSFRLRPAVAEDLVPVAELIHAAEAQLYGHSVYTVADQEHIWRRVDLQERTLVAVDADERVVAYGLLEDRRELWRVQANVHPDAHGRGIGAALAAALEDIVAGRGAQRVQSSVFEADDDGRRLLEGLGYRLVRVFREMRIELDAPPPAPTWPEGLRPDVFDPERDARAFHAGHQEAFADHWEYTPRDFDRWRKSHLESERFDPSLWCVVRAPDGEIAAGTISVADLFGGGWVDVVFTRRPWRGRGVGAALLHDAFARFWERGERSIGLGVDAQSDTGAFRLYERVGMKPVLGWVMYEKALRAA